MGENDRKLVIFCAHKCEAEPFIKHFILTQKKIPGLTVYENSILVVVITGEGSKCMEHCINSIFSAYRVFNILNYGICGCSDVSIKVGSTFQINKIYGFNSDEYYYPDLIYNTGFTEAPIITVSDAKLGASFYKYENIYLVDMESSHIFRLLKNRICTTKLIIIKVVSDHLDRILPAKFKIDEILLPSLSLVLNLCEDILELSIKYDILSKKVEDVIKDLFIKFKFTFTQQAELKRLILFKSYNQLSFIEYVESCLSYSCLTKRETSDLYKKIRNEALSE